MNIILRDAAHGDLEAIFAHIAADNGPAAEKVVGRILTAIELLSVFPQIGRPGRVAGTRERVVSGLPYVVVYVLDVVHEIQVVAILHAARGPSSIRRRMS